MMKTAAASMPDDRCELWTELEKSSPGEIWANVLCCVFVFRHCCADRKAASLLDDEQNAAGAQESV